MAENLRCIRYVGPVRDVPSRIESRAATSEKLWANGEAAWDTISTADEALVQRFDDWIFSLRSSTRTIAFGLSATSRFLKTRLTESRTILKLSTTFPRDVASSLWTKAVNPILQATLALECPRCFPVVVAALARGESSVIVEQPELHIHPQLQANLGDLFIEAIKEGKQFFLETHSENLLLRLLRRIRHTFEGTSEGNSLTPAELQVLYVLPAGHELNRFFRRSRHDATN